MLAERKETLKYIQELQERADTLEAREAERYDQMKKKQQLERILSMSTKIIPNIQKFEYIHEHDIFL